MKAIRTDQSNFTYTGPRPEVADLPCRREEGVVAAVFELTDEERLEIARGAQIRIGIWQEPIPPISIGLVNEVEVEGQVSDEGIPIRPDYRCQGCENLYVSDRAIALELKCGFCGGQLRLPGAA